MNDQLVEKAKKVSVYNLEQKMLLKLKLYQVVFIPRKGEKFGSQAVRSMQVMENPQYEYPELTELKVDVVEGHTSKAQQVLIINFICYTFNLSTVLEILEQRVESFEMVSARQSRSYNPQYGYEYVDPFKNHYKQQAQPQADPGSWGYGGGHTQESIDPKTMEDLMREMFRKGFGGGI